ncbi:MAG: nucleotide exchange factor GrpE [Candidatus Tectomicrobia bacterium]|nr:nucleotide exchange factor GrpE [Candidatus Tectomicrobia bacterium]
MAFWRKKKEEFPFLIDEHLEAAPQEEAGGGSLPEELDYVRKDLARLSQDQIKASSLAEARDEAILQKIDELKRFVERNSAARQESEAEKAIEGIYLQLITNLFPLLEGLDAGLKLGRTIGRSGEKELDELTDRWTDGIERIHEKVKETLEALDVSEIETVGAIFDPRAHIAVETREDPLFPDGTIIEERRKGYAWRGRIVRPAEVIVSSGETRVEG